MPAVFTLGAVPGAVSFEGSGGPKRERAFIMRNKSVIFLSSVIMAVMALAACAQPTTAPAQPTTDIPLVASQAPPVGPSVLIVTATQLSPPVYESKDPTTYVFATREVANLLDPALSYVSGDANIIYNIYDTLITYLREDPNSFVPMLALEVPSLENGGISPDGLTYTFKIRKGVKFHDGTQMTPTDVAYTLQRGLLQGGTQSPQWLLVQPFLGSGFSDITDIITPSLAGPDIETLNDDPANLAKVNPAVLLATCKKITGAIVADDGAGTVTMKLAQPWGPFLATLAGFSQIISKPWIISKGGWDGDCATWQEYYGRTSEQLIEQGLGHSENGTGPFKLESWTPNEEVVLAANQDYWVKEPLWEGGPSRPPKLKNVIFKFIDDFSTRFAMLEAGDVDQIWLDSSAEWPQMDALVGIECKDTLDNCQDIDPLQPLVVIKGLLSFSRMDLYFNFNITTEEHNFIGSGQLDGKGIPPNFFSDPLVRKGFAYCFNYDSYLNEALLGEGVRSVNIMLPGMLGYDETTPIYTYDPAKCVETLEQSRWKKNADGSWTPDPTGENSLWETGFRFTVPYYTGNLNRQALGEILQTELWAVNDKFIIEATGLPRNIFFLNRTDIPIAMNAWGEDIHDPHSWVEPLTIGVVGSRYQLPDALQSAYAGIIQRAVLETDPAKRAEIYKEFNKLYYKTASSIPLFLETDRFYLQRWVKGWYHNPIYGSVTYFYPMWKE
jgi:peptide/nickel transport system substrate-binding protein